MSYHKNITYEAKIMKTYNRTTNLSEDATILLQAYTISHLHMCMTIRLHVNTNPEVETQFSTF